MRFFGNKIFTVFEMTEQDSQRSQKYLNFRAKSKLKIEDIYVQFQTKNVYEFSR